MTTIGLTANPFNERALRLARFVLERLKDRAEVEVAHDTATALGLSGRPLEELDVEALLVLGGDGSFLYTIQRTECPVLGINAGSVGFLTEVEPEHENLEGALERVLRGAYFLEERMKLAAQVGDRILPDALNEIVVHTNQVGKMRSFEISVERQPIGTVRADGIILATPTGSTSYALATGGPAVDPSMDAIVVTTIAPHANRSRPLVVGPLHEVSVRLVDEDRESVVVVDGQHEQRLPLGGVVRCYRSARRARLIKFSSRFFQKLQSKAIIPWEDAVGHAVVPPPP